MTTIRIHQGQELSHDAIAQRAYEIWQRRGCPSGTDGRDDWDAAVKELSGESVAHSHRRRLNGPIAKLWRRLRNRAAL